MNKPEPELEEFEVRLDAHLTLFMTVSAASFEEAAEKAAKSPQATIKLPHHCAGCRKHGPKEVILLPTWVDTKVNATIVDELEHEVVGQCDHCKAWIVSRDREDRPWLYASDEAGSLICWECCQKRGNVKLGDIPSEPWDDGVDRRLDPRD